MKIFVQVQTLRKNFSIMEQQQTPVIEFEQIVLKGCGLDVHEETVVATIDGEGIVQQTRTFDTSTSSLNELREWLLQHGITHVAMESTGVYWKPVFNILEDAFAVNTGQCPTFKKCTRSQNR
jgi:hypothetical protein